MDSLRILQEVEPDHVRKVSVHHPQMKAPKVHDSLLWGKRKGQDLHKNDAELVSGAVSSINKFANDGSFLKGFIGHGDKAEVHSLDVSSAKPHQQPLSANQRAAKAMQLRLKGKHEEAHLFMKDAENDKAEQQKGEKVMTMRQKGKENDGSPTKRRTTGEESNIRSFTTQHLGNCIQTQQERCMYCFENPKTPKHLVVAVANFTYLMLPQFQPVAPGHCCIVPLQHEQGTRMMDDNVWEEIRNFKKCLILMFAKQGKEVIFLETVMELAQQRRHCLIECIPLAQHIASKAPMYFKKAIDDAEDEWSQHEAKKLIDTSQKGLRSSVPENFPYFHVEFGLNRGFLHVIDDEKRFQSSFGLNVVRGMLQNQDEDMYRRRSRYEAVEAQKEAVAAFCKTWEHFDWTKQLC